MPFLELLPFDCAGFAVGAPPVVRARVRVCAFKSYPRRKVSRMTTAFPVVKPP